MLNVDEIVNLHESMVVAWHQQSPDPSKCREVPDDFLDIVRIQHAYNFLLWHEEDKARKPDASDREIAQVKRAIDRLNQLRNDWIEKLDDRLQAHLEEQGVRVKKMAIKCTETPGSAIDRLSIMALRLYHLQEELTRRDVDQGHKAKVRDRFDLCLQQQAHLAEALELLWKGIETGSIQHRAVRQLKMYNDPTLNPEIYKSGQDQRAA